MIAILFVVFVAEPSLRAVVNAFDTVERCEAYKAVQPPLPETYRFECRRELVITMGPDQDEGR